MRMIGFYEQDGDPVGCLRSAARIAKAQFVPHAHKFTMATLIAAPASPRPPINSRIGGMNSPLSSIMNALDPNAFRTAQKPSSNSILLSSKKAAPMTEPVKRNVQWNSPEMATFDKYEPPSTQATKLSRKEAKRQLDMVDDSNFMLRIVQGQHAGQKGIIRARTLYPMYGEYYKVKLYRECVEVPVEACLDWCECLVDVCAPAVLPGGPRRATIVKEIDDKYYLVELEDEVQVRVRKNNVTKSGKVVRGQYKDCAGVVGAVCKGLADVHLIFVKVRKEECTRRDYSGVEPCDDDVARDDCDVAPVNLFD